MAPEPVFAGALSGMEDQYCWFDDMRKELPMLGWILLVILLVAIFGLGTVLEVAVELLLLAVLVVVLLAVAGWFLARSKNTTR